MNSEAKCGYFIDSGVKGAAIGYLNFLVECADIPVPEKVRNDIKKVVDNLRAAECKFYKEVEYA